MRKILGLALMLALMTGAVFAGPVHINGPGVLPEWSDSGKVFFSELFTTADAVSFIGTVGEICKENIVGAFAVAGDYSGFYENVFVDREVVLSIISSLNSVTLFPCKESVVGTLFVQEVKPVYLGCSKPVVSGTMMIF